VNGPRPPPEEPRLRRRVSLLLNVGHALDHLFLLIFATAVGAIAADFGIARWEDLMPYTTGAFFLFGLGSLPAGRLGDLWGRRRMMLLFYFGMGASALAVAATSTPWSMAAALTVMGAFSSIYHPVGIPMLLRHATRPGTTIGINGLAGNLGIAFAAVSTGFLVEHLGWRAAFVVPGVACLLCGLLFARFAPAETAPPVRQRTAAVAAHPRGTVLRVLVIMVVTATTSSVLFNFTTNGNAQLIAERLGDVVGEPSTLGLLLSGAYFVAAFSQLVVGRLIDRVDVRRLFLAIAALQTVAFTLAIGASGWAWFACAIAYLSFMFAAIPFSDTLVVRYVDDGMRSRISGLRLAISFSIGSAAVWGLGPLVKAAGFDAMLSLLAVVAALTLLAGMGLPGHATTMDTTVVAHRVQ
jgi:MFS family permease